MTRRGRPRLGQHTTQNRICVFVQQCALFAAVTACDAPPRGDAGIHDGGRRNDAGADLDGGSDAGARDAGHDAGSDAGARDAGHDAGREIDAGCSPPGVGTERIGFDDVADGTQIVAEHVARGATFARPGGSPVAFGYFASPGSPPNYLMAEHETVDLNPGVEYGNNAPALPIDVAFVDPDRPDVPATTTEVSLNAIYVNAGAVVRLEAYDLAGALLAQNESRGSTGTFVLPLMVSAPAIHRVRIVFGAPGSTGPFEDSAGVDDLEFATVRPFCD